MSEPEVEWTAEFWDDRYAGKPALWSGKPNWGLVAHASELTPGTALDVGCGEGADAVWLAARGWRVLGVDVSTVALQRAATAAAASGVAERTVWQQLDLVAGEALPPGPFDLVSAQYFHTARDVRERVHAALAAAVAPGGTLLIIAHDASDLHTSAHRPHHPELFAPADEIATVLDPQLWDVLVVDTVARPMTDPDGREITVHDAVVKAVRRG